MRGAARTAPAPGFAPPHGGIVLASGVLTALGLVMVYSTTAPLALGHAVPPHFWRQLAGVAAGLAVAAATLHVPLAAWRRLGLPLWGVSVALLLYTLFAGERVNGARRWLAVPGLGVVFQPGELAKWATLIAVAAVLAGREDRRPQQAPWGLVAVLASVPALLLFLQPDTGSAALLLLLVASVLFVAGTPLRAFLAPAALGGLALALAAWLRPYVWDRLRAFWDPWATANDEGFQLVQSFIAFARGGATGVGLGDGRQKLHYLPEAHTDFVLSVVAEELGLIGVAGALGAFVALLLAGCRIATRARSRFGLLLAFGMTGLVVIPAALNAAVVMGIVPPTGLTLPFLSYGRTSLVVCFAAVGVLLAVARVDGAPAPRAVAGAEARRPWRA